MPQYAQPLTDPAEIALWKQILAYEGEAFTTSGRGSRPGIPFTYKVSTVTDPVTHETGKGAELKISRKEKTITRATILRAYRTALAIQAEEGCVSGPKQLGVPGAHSYIYSILLRCGVITAAREAGAIQEQLEIS